MEGGVDVSGAPEVEVEGGMDVLGAPEVENSGQEVWLVSEGRGGPG